MTPSRPIRRRVLIVDDNPTMLGLLRVSLGGALPMASGTGDFEFEYADSGRTAAVMIFTAYRDGCPYEALVLDCAMPVFDGFTVARIVRFVESLNVIPGRSRIAFLSAHDRTVQESKLLEIADHDVYWRKDEVAERIPEVIVEWLLSAPPAMESNC